MGLTRDDFLKSIIHSDKLNSIIDDEAIIDIISPVIKKDNYKWRGYYKSEVIGFQMRDKIFKNTVLKKEIEFVNGTAIKCVLEQSRIIDESGDIKIKNNQVLTVLEIIHDYDKKETSQGKKYKYEKEAMNKQIKLDFNI